MNAWVTRARDVLILVLLVGCTNGYEQFYRPNPALAGSILRPKTFSGEPRVSAGSSDAKRDVRSMYQQGYVLVGISDFIGPAANQSGAIVQAKKVGAAVILISSKYQNTVSGAVPLTVPTATTSYSSGNLNAYGTGGFASGNYSGTTTTYGTQTTYIPYSVDKYEQGALFFAPLERKGFGVMIEPLADEQRRELGTNQGVLVIAVRNESPAFKADVLPGDALLQVGSASTYDVPTAMSALASAAGSNTSITVGRGHERITKQIAMPSGDW